MAIARKKLFTSLVLILAISAMLSIFAASAQCQDQQPCPDRVCFLPVTFTQQGWHDFCDPDNPIINGGMIYNRFRLAFDDFYFFGDKFELTMIVGQKRTITYEAKTSSLLRLCLFLPQTGPCGPLKQNYFSPWSTTEAGSLAGETIALTMNIAYNDMRLMPRTPGYDLELFRVADGPLKGKRVGEVLNIANAILGESGQPCWFGLTSCEALVSVLKKINANYEFVDYCTFNDNGYLIPNRPFGQPDPPHPMHVPFGLI